MNNFDTRLARLEAVITPAEPDPEERRQELAEALLATMDPEHIGLVTTFLQGDHPPTRPPFTTGPERLAREVQCLLMWAESGQVGSFKLALPAAVAEVFLAGESAGWQPYFGRQCGDCDLLLPVGGARWEGNTLLHPPRYFEDGCPDCGGPVDWRRNQGGHRDRPRKVH